MCVCMYVCVSALCAACTCLCTCMRACSCVHVWRGGGVCARVRAVCEFVNVVRSKAFTCFSTVFYFLALAHSRLPHTSFFLNVKRSYNLELANQISSILFILALHIL